MIDVAKVKYVAIYSQYVDCPTCDSMGFSEIKFFRTLKDLIKFTIDNEGIGEVDQIYNSKTGLLADQIDIWYKKGFHRVHYIGINIKGKPYRTFFKDGKTILAPDNEQSVLLYANN